MEFQNIHSLNPKEIRSRSPLLPCEINTIRWAHMLFLPSHTVSAQETLSPKTMTWRMRDQDSSAEGLGRVVVYPTAENQTLTTFDLRTWLALQYHWWNSPGRQERSAIPISLSTLGTSMSRAHARTGREYLEGSLRRLSQVKIEWQDSFRSVLKGATGGKIEKGAVAFTLLEEIDKDPKREHDQRRTRRAQANIGYRFHERIEKKLVQNYTHLIDFETIISIRSELGVSLYTLLNGVLTNRKAWQRNV